PRRALLRTNEQVRLGVEVGDTGDRVEWVVVGDSEWATNVLCVHECFAEPTVDRTGWMPVGVTNRVEARERLLRTTRADRRNVLVHERVEAKSRAGELDEPLAGIRVGGRDHVREHLLHVPAGAERLDLPLFIGQSGEVGCERTALLMDLVP